MSADIQMAFPLRYPAGRPRTAAVDRKAALWRHEGRVLTLDRARRRLREQLAALTKGGQPWRTDNVVLACNVRFTASGARDRNYRQSEPDDVGVALYFDLDGHAHVLACDRWDTVADNIAAIAAHIEALRGQERWGVADLRQAFAGHVALPSPGTAPPPRPWWQVLNLPNAAVSRNDVDVMYRRLAAKRHPDAGGSREQWDELAAAYDAAKRECQP